MAICPHGYTTDTCWCGKKAVVAEPEASVPAIVTDKRCDRCVYWDGQKFTNYSVVSSKQAQTGYCRFGPPERDAQTGFGRWPLTVADEHCHVFAPKEGI